MACGQLVWTVAAAVGVAGLVQASRPAFEVLRLVGAAYLLFLGAQSLWAARRGDTDRHGPAAPVAGNRAFRQGLLSDLANPKMAAFFLSLLPQFAPGHSVFGFLALGGIFCLMTFGWLALYAVVFDRARRLFGRRRVRRALDALGGAVLVGLGLRIAAEAAR